MKHNRYLEVGLSPRSSATLGVGHMYTLSLTQPGSQEQSPVRHRRKGFFLTDRIGRLSCHLTDAEGGGAQGRPGALLPEAEGRQAHSAKKAQHAAVGNGCARKSPPAI